MSGPHLITAAQRTSPTADRRQHRSVLQLVYGGDCRILSSESPPCIHVKHTCMPFCTTDWSVWPAVTGKTLVSAVPNTPCLKRRRGHTRARAPHAGGPAASRKRRSGGAWTKFGLWRWRHYFLPLLIEADGKFCTSLICVCTRATCEAPSSRSCSKAQELPALSHKENARQRSQCTPTRPLSAVGPFPSLWLCIDGA